MPGQNAKAWWSLLPMQIVEGSCRISTSKLGEYDRTAGVGVDEVGQIVDLVVNDTP